MQQGKILLCIVLDIAMYPKLYVNKRSIERLR